jgi:hypothetical protein
MSENWQVGDLAQCAHERSWHPEGTERNPDLASFAESLFFPTVGSVSKVYEVIVVGPDVHTGVDEGDLCYIRVEGFVPYFDARLFRKVNGSAIEEQDHRAVEEAGTQPEQVPA